MPNSEASWPMSRYYPGFLAAVFVVLLRIAIGWHFLHEGLEKVRSTEGGEGTILCRDLSAEREWTLCALFPADDSGRRQPGSARPGPAQGRVDWRSFADLESFRLRRGTAEQGAGDPGPESSVRQRTGSTTRQTPRSSRSTSMTLTRRRRLTAIRSRFRTRESGERRLAAAWRPTAGR